MQPRTRVARAISVAQTTASSVCCVWREVQPDVFDADGLMHEELNVDAPGREKLQRPSHEHDSFVDCGYALVAPRLEVASRFIRSVRVEASMVAFAFATPKQAVVVRVDDAVSVRLQQYVGANEYVGARWSDVRMLPTQITLPLDGVYRLIVYRSSRASTRLLLRAAATLYMPNVVGDSLASFVTTETFDRSNEDRIRAPANVDMYSELDAKRIATTLQYVNTAVAAEPTLTPPLFDFDVHNVLRGLPAKARYCMGTRIGSDGEVYDAHWLSLAADGDAVGLVFRRGSAIPVFCIEAGKIVGCNAGEAAF